MQIGLGGKNAMNEAHEELIPLTAIQFLDAGIWREMGSNEPKPREAFIEALSRLLARWMLTRSQAPEMETLTTFLQNTGLHFEPWTVYARIQSLTPTLLMGDLDNT